MKRMTMLLLLVLTLIAGALAVSVPPVQACNAPNCFASPGCCSNRQCDSFCGGAGLGFCGPSQCCTCQG